MRDYPPETKHPDIDLIQLGLTRAGYAPGAIDSIFGPKTQAALAHFRRDRNLAAVPAITQADWQAMTPFLVGYVRRTIQAGDTFFRLAKGFRTTVSAIETANPDAVPDALQVGQKLIIPLDFSVVPTNIHFTSRVLFYTLNGLTARYPRIQQGSIGKSVTGIDLPILRFGVGPHAVSYNAAHHGNEWITSPVLLKFLEEYAKAQSTASHIGGLDAGLLYSSSTLHLIPMVCPDGVDIATGALDSGPYYEYATLLAENYPHIPFPDGWKANVRGVDINLQYPASWEKAREIKFAQGFTKPGPRDYVGSAALSEPESRAMYEYTLQHDFQLILAYHSQGEVIYWQYLDYLPPGSREIGETFAKLSGYALEDTPFASGHAGYRDWFIQRFNRPGYTIEVGRGVNPLPISQFDKIYADNRAMLATGLIISAQ